MAYPPHLQSWVIMQKLKNIQLTLELLMSLIMMQNPPKSEEEKKLFSRIISRQKDIEQKKLRKKERESKNA